MDDELRRHREELGDMTADAGMARPTTAVAPATMLQLWALGDVARGELQGGAMRGARGRRWLPAC
jgi:hypothetical protein